MGPVRYGHGAVSLYESVDDAMKDKRQIDQTGCGGGCRRDHVMVMLELP